MRHLETVVISEHISTDPLFGMEAPAYLREQAERCRRLAGRLWRMEDPTRLGLLYQRRRFVTHV